jgi:small conductance mechanosensitive channel
MLDQNPQHIVSSLELLAPLIVSNALHVIAALLILIIGFWIAGKVQVLVSRSLSRTPHFDPMLQSFFGHIARYFVLTLVLLAVLAQFGIQTTSLVAVVGAASLAVGLALQGTLSHLAAGVMLLIFRPFRIGQHVTLAGTEGTVKDLSLFWTEVVTADNVQVIIPNGSVWGQQVRNFSTYTQPTPTAQVRFRLPDANPSAARQKIADVVKANPNVLPNPAPSVVLDRNAADNALEFVATFAPLGGADAAAAVRSEIIEAVHDAVEAAPK